MKRRSIVDDMKATLMDDLDALSAGVPAFAAVAEKIREVVGPVDRKAKRLTAEEKAKLTVDQVATGARGAFGRAVQRLNAEDKARRAKKKNRAAQPSSSEGSKNSKTKAKRRLGPERD